MTLDEMEARITTLEQSYTVILEAVERLHTGMIETDALIVKSLQAQRRVTELIASLATNNAPKGDWQ